MIPESLIQSYKSGLYKKDLLTPWVIMENKIYLKYDYLVVRLDQYKCIEVVYYYRTRPVRVTKVPNVDLFQGGTIKLNFEDQISFIPVEGL